MKRERGQALVEFSMVLPLLLLLSFGTLEVGLYLQRRLVMGGATFVAARAASVQGPRAQSAAVKVLQTYSQDSQSKWVGESAGTARVGRKGPGLLVVGVSRDGDAWTGALTGSVQLLGGHLDPQAKWKAEAPIGSEFVPGSNWRAGYTASPTDTMVDYQVELAALERLRGIGNFVASIPGLGGTGKALNPLEQAVPPNPQLRKGSTSPSKMYVSPYAEEKVFTQAQDIIAGLGRTSTGIKAYAGTYYAAVSLGQIDKAEAMRKAAEPLALVDRSVNLDARAKEIEKLVHGIFGAKGSK